MNFNKKIIVLFIFLTFMIIAVGVVSAQNNESTASSKEMLSDNTQKDIIKNTNQSKIEKTSAQTTKKTTPNIKMSINSSSYKGGDIIKIKAKVLDDKNTKFNGYSIFKLNGKTLRDSKNNVIKVKLVNNTATLKYKMPRLLVSSSSKITAVLQVNNYGKYQISKRISHARLVTKATITSINVESTSKLRLQATLTDERGKNCLGRNVMTVKINGKTVKNAKNQYVYYMVSNGKIDIKVPISVYKKATHSIQIVVGQTAEYTQSRSNTLTFQAKQKENSKIILDIPNKVKSNSVLSMRVYVQYANSKILKNVENGKVKVLVNGKMVKVVNVSYGKAIFNYKTPTTGTYTITAIYYGGSKVYDKGTTKKLIVTKAAISSADSQIKGNKNPEKTLVTTNNGVPNLVYMTNYIWADESATYTLTKNQYLEVIKKDSYCLYLNKKLSKYISFKTNSKPNYHLVLRREKWNVIERYINQRLVASNGGPYPESITVSLKGKAYTYSEVRDVQNTGYTCGPTSLSTCTQVLRNYNSESKLARAAGTTSSAGSSTFGLKRAAESYSMSATVYYKSSFGYALNELSKGGCALVFHTWNHYVAIIDISKDKSHVLVSNPSGSYNQGSHGIPTKWVSVSYIKKCFNNYDTSGLIVKLNYKLSSSKKLETNYYYNNMVAGWTRSNTNERIINT